MSREPEWIDGAEALARELGRLDSGGFSLDTEADSMHHFREKVCLIQISARDTDLLIDPLCGLDLTALGSLLADPGTRKILHGADYDLRMLHRDFSFEVRGLYDTMIAARLVGERAFGLAALLEKHLGIRLDKRFQRADWSRRPLSVPMREYAASDTRYLEDLVEILDRKLATLGRTAWAAEEFRRLEQVRSRSRPPSEEAYRRIKGAGRLGRRELAVLREVAILRDGIAEERDLPRFRVVHDEVLLELARSGARGNVDTARLPGLPRSWKSGRRNGSLLERIERAMALPDGDLPERVRKPRAERDPALEGRVRKLRGERDRLAEELGLEPSVLASRAILEGVSRCLARAEAVEDLPDLRRWQLELLAPFF